MRTRWEPGGFLFLGLLSLVLEPWEAGLVLLAALWHEGGHLLALGLAGGQAGALVGGWGGFRLVTRGLLPYGAEALVALAGPGFSLVGAVWAAWAGWNLLAGASLALGLMNLLPLSPLDGGAALHALVAAHWGPNAAWWVSLWADLLTLALLTALGTAALLRYQNPTLLAVGLSLLPMQKASR